MIQPHRLAVLTAGAAIAVHLAISASLLTNLGDAYISDGGCMAEKIHPGSILAIAAGAISVVTRRHEASKDRYGAARDGAVFVFLACLSFCSAQALILTGQGNVIALLDTFLPAGCIALALSRATLTEDAALRRMLQCLFFLNAAIANAEALLQAHLVPIVADGPIEAEFRSTALYDHPLTGASASMIGFFLAPDRSEAPIWSITYMAVLLASLLAFGERTPLFIALLASAFTAIYDTAITVLSRRTGAKTLLDAAFYGVLTVIIAAAATAGGLGTRLAAHLYWDPSAQVRLSVFGIVRQLDASQLLFGIPRLDLTALIEPMRLQAGVQVVENFWLVMLLNLGVAGFPAFIIGMAALLLWLWRRADRHGRIMVVSLILAASTSNSLGRKSMLLTTLVAAVLASRPVRPCATIANQQAAHA